MPKPRTQDAADKTAERGKPEKKKKKTNLLKPAAGELLGVNADGSTFIVPKLPNTLETFLFPKQWDFSTLFTIVLSGITVYVGLVTESLVWVYSLSLFWRLMYNVFLGYVLNVQSQTMGFTKLVERSEKQPHLRKFLNNRLSAAVAASPLSVRSWVHFRLVATTILDLDVVAFMCVVYREWLAHSGTGSCTGDSLDYFCVPDWLAYPLGALLIVTSLYGKASAHRTLGHYAWFWGDFFFRVSGSLVFDGIFELFPHPMYTAGYAWMYGFALIVRSYGLFALVIICHLLQMGFLSAVETPHIEKIYGKDEPATGSQERVSNFFAPKNFDFFRAGDLSSVLVAVFFAGFCFLGVEWNPNELSCEGAPPHQYSACVPLAVVESTSDTDGGFFGISNEMISTWLSNIGVGAGPSSCTLRAGTGDFWCNTTDGGVGRCNCGRLTGTFFIANALFWRCVQAAVTGFVLHRQAKFGWWVKHFTSRGSSVASAFQNWVQVQNLLATTCYISFAAAAWYFFDWQHSVLSLYGLSTLLTAVCMIFVSIWTFQECYNVLGDFGWYYGDFFMPNPRLKVDASSTKKERAAGLSYVGIYRYLNNPSTVLGFLGFYAVALICQSWTVASIAGVSQGLHVLLVAVVEEPHTKELYTSQVRNELAHLRQLKDKLKKARVAARRGIDSVRRRGFSNEFSTDDEERSL